MSECSLQMYGSEVRGHRCSRCGLGPCEVWRSESPPVAEEPPFLNGDGTRPEPELTETNLDPAYAAALSEQAILVEARAKALGLAIKLLGPMAAEAQTDIAPDTLKGVANDFLRYLLEGK